MDDSVMDSAEYIEVTKLKEELKELKLTLNKKDKLTYILKVEEKQRERKLKKERIFRKLAESVIRKNEESYEKGRKDLNDIIRENEESCKKIEKIRGDAEFWKDRSDHWYQILVLNETELKRPTKQKNELQAEMKNLESRFLEKETELKQATEQKNKLHAEMKNLESDRDFWKKLHFKIFRN
jgi:chromosome segregation ATPase